MRTFIAIDIPATEGLKDFYSDITTNINSIDIKYTELNNCHITLAFLGETTNSQVTELCKSLEAINLNFNKIELSLTNVGFFKNGQVPSVIWVGIEQNQQLLQLRNKINFAVSSIGFTVEERKFQPHLTIGRVKRAHPNHNLESFKVKYQKASFGTIPVTEFIYYQSILTPQGPVYKPIKKFKI